MSPAATRGYEWETLPWRELERGVCKLQTRIFRASERAWTASSRRRPWEVSMARTSHRGAVCGETRMHGSEGERGAARPLLANRPAVGLGGPVEYNSPPGHAARGGDAMRFHIVQLTTYFPDRDPPLDVYFQQILEQIQLAEELGWEGFWFTEHHFIPYGGLIANPAVMMAAAAARTSTIRLGSSISILPLRHPVQTAEDYAMVDVASGGRLEFGIGRGNTLEDYTVYGIPWTRAAAASKKPQR